MSSRTERFLAVRLGALGDLVHTLPAMAALRATFPDARLDWVVDRRWAPFLQLVSGIDEVIPLDRTPSAFLACMGRLRKARYSCAIDFQGLYRSAVVTRLSGAPRRVGRDRSTARESGAAWFYTERVIPAGRHIAEMSVSLAVHAGARQPDRMQFPIRVPQEEADRLRQELLAEGVRTYAVMSPGGGWASKRWPPERYGALCAELWRRHAVRTVVNTSRTEQDLAEKILLAAGTGLPAAARPMVMRPELPELTALLAGASVVVGADTGPVHLAAALGARVVALFGSTDPARNGPLPQGRVVQNSSSELRHYQRGDYERGDTFAPAMLSITVDQVLAAVERELTATP